MLTCITKEMYLVKELKANFLIENDFSKSKEFVIDVNNKKVTIVNC